MLGLLGLFGLVMAGFIGSGVAGDGDDPAVDTDAEPDPADDAAGGGMLLPDWDDGEDGFLAPQPDGPDEGMPRSSDAPPSASCASAS